MKHFKVLALGIATFAFMALSNAAQAETWNCGLSGNIHGASLGLGLSGQLLHGTGEVRCRSNDTGRVRTENVKLALVGAGVGFDFTIVKSLRVVAAGIQTERPDALLGSFDVGAIAGATLINNAIDVDAAMSVSNRELGFQVGLVGENAYGLGVRLQGMAFKVTRN